eukprot:GHVL01013531.1.p1 GENE.GHVL01013531.1~~GHVL01013531.1.p1  ORF type:complete len:369 (+),score=76.14 GHVL01013531.1:96-1202(+)
MISKLKTCQLRHFGGVRPVELKRVYDETAEKERNNMWGQKFREEDITRWREQSIAILKDPICNVTTTEMQRSMVALPPYRQDFWARAYRRTFGRINEDAHAANAITNLIQERLENELLTSAFRIDESFNMRMYFWFAHAWMIHKRLRTEDRRGIRIGEDLFKNSNMTIQSWMALKNVPEYTWYPEIRNTHGYMIGFMLAFDDAMKQPDIMPAKIQENIWANVYGGNVAKNASFVILFTKYFLRQFQHILMLDKESFLTGHWTWVDFPLLSAPGGPQNVISGKVAFTQKFYGGFRPDSRDTQILMGVDFKKKILEAKKRAQSLLQELPTAQQSQIIGQAERYKLARPSGLQPKKLKRLADDEDDKKITD